MIEYMVSGIICHEFEKVVGKGQHETGKAMHVGFDLSCGASSDQYRVCHMYIFAPCNYVYVAIQEERIDAKGKRHVGAMEILSYHDSCWRDAVQNFIFKRSRDLSGFRALGRLFDWYTLVKLTEDEKNYLRRLENYKTAFSREAKGPFTEPNPFDNRGLWTGNRGGGLWVEASQGA